VIALKWKYVSNAIKFGLFLAAAPILLFAMARAGTESVLPYRVILPPLLIASLPVIFLRTRFVRVLAFLSSATLILYLCVYLGFTYISWLYIPSAISLLVGGLLPDRRLFRDPGDYSKTS
jgi:hypothetical protein